MSADGGRTVKIEGAINGQDLISELSRVCEKHGSKSEFARKSGIPVSAISDILSGRRAMNDTMANALGYVRPTFYVPARRSQL